MPSPFAPPLEMGIETIATVYGTFVSASKRRLDLTYDYEHAQIRTLRTIAERIQPQRLLDIGANIGVYAVYLRPIESFEHLHAFEPARDTFEVLVDNLALQQDPRLEAVPCALSNEDGTALFKVFGDLTGDNAIAATARRARRPAVGEYAVETKRLDAILDASGERFIAKIDVEGHEQAVLDGAVGYLGSNRGVVQIECFPDKVGGVIASLGALGYRRIGWLHHDHIFTNLAEPGVGDELVEIMFGEVQLALGELQELRLMRRAAVRSARATLDTVRYPHDPVAV